jgi:hypothetical protein
MLLEVLQMRNMTPEQMGLDYEALIELIGKERAINLIGKKQVIDVIGKEQVIDLIGEEELQRLLERRRQSRSPQTDPPTNPN